MFGMFKLFLTRHNSNHTHCGIDCTIADFMHISYDILLSRARVYVGGI